MKKSVLSILMTSLMLVTIFGVMNVSAELKDHAMNANEDNCARLWVTLSGYWAYAEYSELSNTKITVKGIFNDYEKAKAVDGEDLPNTVSNSLGHTRSSDDLPCPMDPHHAEFDDLPYPMFGFGLYIVSADPGSDYHCRPHLVFVTKANCGQDGDYKTTSIMIFKNR